MSDKKCCVPGCAVNKGSHKTLHQFPNPVTDAVRFRTWIYAVGGDILKLKNEYIYKYRRVCHAHFEERFCCRFNKISNIATPTLHMPGYSAHKFTSINQERVIQNLPENKPSTSKDDYSLFSAERSHYLFQEKEGEQGSNVAHSDLDKENSGSSDHKLTSTKQRPLRPIENLPGNEPSTSKDDYTHCSEERTHLADKNRVAAEKIVPQISVMTKDITKCIKQKQPTIQKKTKRIAMTKLELSLYKKLVAVRMKLCKQRSRAKKQSLELKAAKNIVTNPGFLKALENLPSAAKILTLLQFREQKKHDRGRRFRIEEKIMALSILKQSPKAYRFLRRIFILPAAQTLLKLLQKADVKPGINEKIFQQLKKKAAKMMPVERLCILTFDEMSLKPNVSYNERSDVITGFTTDGTTTTPVFAHHAQVFLMRGLVKNYKQPVSYTFSAGATKGPDLAKQIKQIIEELQKAGFRVVATVCDQGTNNRQAIKTLVESSKEIYLRRGETLRENVIIINNEKIVPIYDPPHLLKGLRNNLLTKNLKYTMGGQSKTAKWCHIKLFHEENPGYKGIRLVPKLTDNHVLPHKIGKMKVKFASQVFSKTVASNMGYLADKGILPKECQETADLLLFVDSLFDSVNGSFANKKRHSKPLLGPVTPNSIHHKSWFEAKKVLKSMAFINERNSKENVPTLNNWVWTLEGLETLTKMMKDEFSITSLWMRHLNQDPIENFFGAIRSHGCRNTNPTASQFQSAYATLLVNNLTSVHAPGANCEVDFCEALVQLITTEGCKDATTNQPGCEIDLNEILNIELVPLQNKTDQRIMAPLQYLSGYFVRKAKHKIYKNCQHCARKLERTQGELEYIRYREYGGHGWLCNPSDGVIKIVSNMQDVMTETLKNHLEKNNIKEYCKTIMTILVDLRDLEGCDIHKSQVKEFTLDTVTRFFIFNYCKNLNKIMCGKIGPNDVNDGFQVKAKNIFNKCYRSK